MVLPFNGYLLDRTFAGYYGGTSIQGTILGTRQKCPLNIYVGLGLLILLLTNK